MTRLEAQAITGGLSKPSKMPCFGYSIPAKDCRMGSKLRAVENSVCSKCYALKGRYVFPNVQQAMEKRLQSLVHPQWIEAMAFLINSTKNSFFRWHDSGDIQSLWHLCNLVAVAKRCPQVKFWLPTREYGFVKQYVEAFGAFPDNFTVRLSAYMLDAPAPTAFARKLGVQTSTVSSKEWNCLAFSQGGKCLDCRACWYKTEENISYKRH